MLALLLAPLLVYAVADIPKSVAERSQYSRTATEAELDEILAATVAVDSRWQRFELGISNEGRPIHAVRVGFDNSIDLSLNPQQRVTIVIIGGIHAGECAGKEAMCDLLREIAAGQHASWLDHFRLVIIPSLSPDSNSRRAVDNRPGQVGPSEGMGQRANAQGLDLNRDFIKLETPEIRALVDLIQQTSADVLIDLHTTNGSQHRYDLTYDPPHHPQTPTVIRDWLRKELFPAVTQRAAAKGIELFYYGNFDRTHSRWQTFGYEGRYSTNYMGLRNRIGILSEAYSYATYQRRIEASHQFVVDTLDYIDTHADDVAQVLRTAKLPPATGASSALTAELVPFPEPFLVKGYLPDPPEEGIERKPHDYEVSFFGNFQPRLTTTLPDGYFVPADQQAIIDLLTRHGIELQSRRLETGEVRQRFQVTSQEVAKEKFQGHASITVQGDWQTTTIDTPIDGYWVSCNQPLASLIVVLLEPQSPDSMVTWELIPSASYPVLR